MSCRDDYLRWQVLLMLAQFSSKKFVCSSWIGDDSQGLFCLVNRNIIKLNAMQKMHKKLIYAGVVSFDNQVQWEATPESLKQRQHICRNVGYTK